MTSIVEWFDPNNKDHVTAYKHFQESGMWPYKFIPMDLEFPVGWDIAVKSKMVDAWINHMLGGQ